MRDLNLDTIQSTYNDILKRATLENRAKSLGVTKKDVVDMLLTQPILSSQGNFPRSVKWKNLYPSIILYMDSIAASMFAILFYFSIHGNVSYIPNIIFIIAILAFIFNAAIITYLNRIDKQEKGIIFRNAYKALAGVFVLGDSRLKETPEEENQCNKFKNRKKLFSH